MKSSAGAPKRVYLVWQGSRLRSVWLSHRQALAHRRSLCEEYYTHYRCTKREARAEFCVTKMPVGLRVKDPPPTPVPARVLQPWRLTVDGCGKVLEVRNYTDMLWPERFRQRYLKNSPMGMPHSESFPRAVDGKAYRFYKTLTAAEAIELCRKDWEAHEHAVHENPR